VDLFSFNKSNGTLQKPIPLTGVPSVEVELEMVNQTGTDIISRNTVVMNYPRKPTRKSTISMMKDTYDIAYNNKITFLFIYLYMISDFYIRTYPIIGIIAFFNNNNIKKSLLVWLVYVAIIGIYSYCMCYYMRKYTKNLMLKSHKFLIKIFFVTIFSSFYNLLCCIHFLEKDNYFGLSVQFNRHLLEHIIKIILSILAYVSLFALIGHYNADQSDIIDLLPFLVLYIVFLIINIVSIYWIRAYIVSNENKKIVTNV